MPRPFFSLTALTLAAAMFITPIAPPAAAQDRGLGARDDAAPLTTNGMLDRKDDLSPDLFFRYWRDVHGPLAARIDGIHQYWQHRLDAPDPSLLPEAVTAAGIATDVTDADRLEGIAETTFASEADRVGLGSEPAAGQLFEDERNAFRATYLHGSVAGNTRTALDRIADPMPQGDDGTYRLQLLFRANEDGDRAAFQSHVTDTLTPALAAADGALKVRTHLFEPYDPSGWDTPDVENDRTQDQAFDAQIELAFETRGAAEAALAGAADALARPNLIAGLHAYPVTEVFTQVYDGRPTLVGLRGYPIVEVIEATGAENQTTLPVLRSITGAETEEPAG